MSELRLGPIVNIESDGEVGFAPGVVAYTDDGTSGWIGFPGRAGEVLWKPGEGTASGDGWHVCIGDAITRAVMDGKIPTRRLDEMPPVPRIATSPEPRSWPINKFITLVDDGPAAATFDLGQQSLSLLRSDVPKVIAALQEWQDLHR
jgi:hypothetical protein